MEGKVSWQNTCDAYFASTSLRIRSRSVVDSFVQAGSGAAVDTPASGAGGGAGFETCCHKILHLAATGCEIHSAGGKSLKASHLLWKRVSQASSAELSVKANPKMSAAS